jgi:hypothetical protein
MAQDFMNTQTGGEGETIQLQTDVKSTPEQFDVNLPQQSNEQVVESSNPNPQPQVVTVPNEGEVVEQPPIPFAPVQTEVTEEVKTEPIVPQEPSATEPEKKETKIPFKEQKENEIVALPSSITMFSNPIGYKSEFDANNPYVKNTGLLTPTIDVINTGEIVGQDFTVEDDSGLIFESEADREEYEEMKRLRSLDPAVQSYVQAVSQSEEDPTIKQMNEIIAKGKKQGGYDGILERVTQSTADESTFADVDVPDVEFNKIKVSSNYNNWAEIMGVTEDQISDMAYKSVVNQNLEDRLSDIGVVLRDLSKQKDIRNAYEEALELGYVTPEVMNARQGQGVQGFVSGTKLDKSMRADFKRSINESYKSERDLRKQLVDLNNQKIQKDNEKYIPPKAPVTKLQEFEDRVNNDLKKVWSTKWSYVGEDQGVKFYKSPVNLGLSSDGFTKDNISTPSKIKEIKDQAKWLDQEGRSLIQQSVAKGNPNIFFNNPNAKNLNPGLTEYARDLFEVEYNKDFKKNGNVDPYTYDGFKRTAAKVAKENSTKLNSSIANNAEDIVSNVMELNEKWVSKNQKILTDKLNQVKTSMDDVLAGQIISEIQRNPQAAAIRDKYSGLISMAPSKEEAAKLNDQMMAELKTIPAIGKSFGEYKENLDAAVYKLQSDYYNEWHSFRQDLYTNSMNDLTNKISATTKEIYRGGINNDLNIYQGQSNVKDPDKIPLGADGVVKSKRFKEASYYEKRKMISSQWELEKAALINYTNDYIKRNVEKYPANKEEASKHWSEWTGYRSISDKEKNQWLASMPERTGTDAKNRYVFYAVDDLLYPNNNKPTVFGIKSFADAELDKIKYLEEKFGFKVGDHIGDYGDTRDKLPISQKEEEQLLSTKKMLQEVLSHPETDQEWYNELLNGLSGGFDIPILGAFVGIQRNQNLRDAMDRYQDGTFDSFDISMTEAQAALNKLNEIKPPSTAYQIGAGLGFTTTFMLEMAMTGGVNQIGRSVGTKVVQTVTNLGKSATDDVVRVAAERATPETIQRIEKIGAFLGGGMVEGASSPRAYEMFTEKMLQNITIQELGTYDGLIAQFDNTSKNEFNEFFKAYANWIGMATIERLGAHMPVSGVSKEVLEYMGTETFLKRTMMGAWFRSAGFKTIDEAAEYLATTSMPWSGIIPEFSEELLQGAWESLVYGEQVFGPEKQADGTKEIKFFGMTPEEMQVTAASVAIFGAGSTMVQNAKAMISNDAVTIQADDIDGTSQIVQIDKESWNKFNGIISDPNLSWQAVSKMLEQSNLSVEEQRAMATVFIKTRGLEILADKDYQQWKEENKDKIDKNNQLREELNKKLDEEESKLTEEEKGLRDYQFMTTGLQYDNEGNPMNFWEALNAKDNMYMTINALEQQLSDANMPIVGTDENGEVVETNTKENAEKIVKRKKKSDADKEKTPKGKKTTKIAKPSKTEPVETINTEENDQENQPGVSSQVGEGQKPVETQPITQTGEETPSVSGVVQGEQKVAIGETVEVNGKKYTKVETSLVGEPKGTAYQGEDGVSYNTEWVEKNMTPKAATVTEQSVKTEELPANQDSGVELNGKKLTVQEAIDLYKEDIKELESQERTLAVDKKLNSLYDAVAKLEAKNKNETANPFEEISEANKLKGTAKTKAIKELKQKYGADYNRISKIDTNFARIVKTLEKNNLINKDC